MRQASKGRLGLVGFLLQHGAKLGTRDKQGATPLHRAAAAGKVQFDFLTCPSPPRPRRPPALACAHETRRRRHTQACHDSQHHLD